MRISRILASLMLILVAPVLLVKIAWFVPTLGSLQDAISELGIEGTPAYIEERTRRIHHGIFAVGLYLSGFLTVGGLFGVAAGWIQRRRLMMLVWLSVLFVSSGLICFEYPRVRSSGDVGYAAFFLVVPIIVAVVAALVLLVLTGSGASWRGREPAARDNESDSG